ncbi:MAG TPA: DivIVA domain-containing protein [Gaiellaceae bacterium]|nr:DivIVA domain-containing protein [Gaiellaceae bacterium]
MSLTPVEIRHVTLRRRLFGYEREAVDRLLEEVAVSFEGVWRDRADVRDEIERLESELRRQREIEEALRNTLLSAERMADELRARAHQESDLIVEEARARAREIAASAEAEQERAHAEIRRVRGLETEVRAEYRAFLVAALERLDGESHRGRNDSGQGRHQAA